MAKKLVKHIEKNGHCENFALLFYSLGPSWVKIQKFEVRICVKTVSSKYFVMRSFEFWGHMLLHNLYIKVAIANILRSSLGPSGPWIQNLKFEIVKKCLSSVFADLVSRDTYTSSYYSLRPSSSIFIVMQRVLFTKRDIVGPEINLQFEKQERWGGMTVHRCKMCCCPEVSIQAGLIRLNVKFEKQYAKDNES